MDKVTCYSQMLAWSQPRFRSFKKNLSDMLVGCGRKPDYTTPNLFIFLDILLFEYFYGPCRMLWEETTILVTLSQVSQIQPLFSAALDLLEQFPVTSCTVYHLVFDVFLLFLLLLRRGSYWLWNQTQAHWCSFSTQKRPEVVRKSIGTNKTTKKES